MKARKIILLIGLLICTTGAWAVDAEETFRQANTAYEQKDFNKAISLYEQLLGEGYRSSALLYNLGMACLEQQQLGKAVLYLERALLIKPGDKDIKHNLRIIRTQYLKDQLDIIPESFLLRWWKNAFQAASSQVWTILSLLFIWLAMAGLSIWRIGKSRKIRKWGFFVGISLFLISVLFGNLAYSRYSFEYNNGRGVVMVLETPFHVAPDPESEEIMNLHAGTICKVVDELNSWYKIRLTDGQQGWMPKQSIRLL